jgi:hypothetical protein
LGFSFQATRTAILSSNRPALVLSVRWLLFPCPFHGGPHNISREYFVVTISGFQIELLGSQAKSYSSKLENSSTVGISERGRVMQICPPIFPVRIRRSTITIGDQVGKFLLATPVDNARKLYVTFFGQDEKVPPRFVSKNPKLSPEGKIAHDFDGRFAIDSVKNVVLAAKPDGPGLISVRKAAEDVLELEVRFDPDPLWIFAIGISSFLAKAK